MLNFYFEIKFLIFNSNFEWLKIQIPKFKIELTL